VVRGFKLAAQVLLKDSLPDGCNDPLTFPIETTRQRTGGFKAPSSATIKNMRSSKDKVIELLNRWKSEPTRVMVVFMGTFSRVNFTITDGRVLEVTEDRVSIGTPDAGNRVSSMLDFSLNGAEFNIGAPVDEDPLSFDLRAREVEVLEVFPVGTDNTLRLFEFLPAIDVPTLLQ
jgi:hypothetical protein